MAIRIKGFRHDINAGRITFVAENAYHEEVPIEVERTKFGYTYTSIDEEHRISDDNYESLTAFIEGCGDVLTDL